MDLGSAIIKMEKLENTIYDDKKFSGVIGKISFKENGAFANNVEYLIINKLTILKPTEC